MAPTKIKRMRTSCLGVGFLACTYWSQTICCLSYLVFDLQNKQEYPFWGGIPLNSLSNSCKVLYIYIYFFPRGLKGPLWGKNTWIQPLVSSKMSPCARSSNQPEHVGETNKICVISLSKAGRSARQGRCRSSRSGQMSSRRKDVSPVTRKVEQGIILFKEWDKTLEHGWLPKTTMGEENGESNLR